MRLRNISDEHQKNPYIKAELTAEKQVKYH